MAAFWKPKVPGTYHFADPIEPSRLPSKKTSLLLGSLIGFFLIPVAGYALSNHISNSETMPPASGSQSNSSANLQIGASQVGSANNPSSSSSTSVSASSQTSTSGGTNTSVTVNGQPVDVPNNGSFDKTISDDNGQTHVHVDVNNNSTSLNNHTSSSSVQIYSESHSSGGSTDTRVQQEEQLRQGR